MQYSKFKWIISGATDGHVNVFQYCYSDIYFIVIFILVSLFSKYRKSIFIIFLIFYYLSVLNFTSWFIQGRPFSFIDVYRSFQFFLFYPEFLSKIETGLKIKLIVFALVPPVVPLVIHLFNSTLKFPKNNFYQTIKNIIIAVLSLGVLSFPIGIYAKVFRYSTPVEIIGNVYYEMKIRQISRHPEKAYCLLGIGNKNHHVPPRFNFNSKNIIFFIIETAPYDFYPSLNELCDLTDNSWLKRHGRVYTKHYSVYPESERAIYSIISGKYPPLANGDSWKQTFKPSGLAKFLKNQGYSTYFLGTAPLEFHDDRALIERLGFENIYNVKETRSALRIVNGKKAWDRTKIYHFDQILINQALEDIAAHGLFQEKRPFFLVLAPQASHAPFQIPPGNDSVASDKERIRLNAIWQFRLLKLLVRQLSVTGQLDNTLIVITGDHGIRSKYESNLFQEPQVLQSISFHVPLMIAFSEMQSSTEGNYVTSHVDIATTIVSGFHSGSMDEVYHGIDLFGPSLPDRNVFLFGGGYLPVSGLIDNKGYFMENRYIMQAYKSKQFNFSKKSGVLLTDREREELVNKMIIIQSLLKIE